MKTAAYFAIPFAFVAFVALLPSGCVALLGGFTSKVVFTQPITTTHRLDLTKRVLFPANEFLDPKVEIEALLIEERSSNVVSRSNVKLSEDSDYVAPQVTIVHNRAVLSGFDRRSPTKEIALTLPPHQSDKQLALPAY